MHGEQLKKHWQGGSRPSRPAAAAATAACHAVKRRHAGPAALAVAFSAARGRCACLCHAVGRRWGRRLVAFLLEREAVYKGGWVERERRPLPVGAAPAWLIARPSATPLGSHNLRSAG